MKQLLGRKVPSYLDPRLFIIGMISASPVVPLKSIFVISLANDQRSDLEIVQQLHLGYHIGFVGWGIRLWMTGPRGTTLKCSNQNKGECLFRSYLLPPLDDMKIQVYSITCCNGVPDRLDIPLCGGHTNSFPRLMICGRHGQCLSKGLDFMIVLKAVYERRFSQSLSCEDRFRNPERILSHISQVTSLLTLYSLT